MSGPTEVNLNSTTPAEPSGKQNCIFQAGAPYIDPLTGLLERDATVYPPSAASGLEGAVALSGDIGGTSGTPKVVGIQGVGVSATSPTNGQVLQYNSGSGLYVPTTLAGSSGGGGDPFDLMLSPLLALTPPSLSSLTWGNQGSGGTAASASANLGGALYVSALGANSNNIVMLYKTPPSTPYTFTLGFLVGSMPSSNSLLAGIAVRLSSSGKIVFFECGQGGDSGKIEVANYTNYTAFSAALTPNATNCLFPAGIIWQQLHNDGTTLTWKLAIDGQNFKTIASATISSFIGTTPDQVGLGLFNYDGTTVSDALFVHWNGI